VQIDKDMVDAEALNRMQKRDGPLVDILAGGRFDRLRDIGRRDSAEKFGRALRGRADDSDR
jgi:hypothetical protein